MKAGLPVWWTRLETKYGPSRVGAKLSAYSQCHVMGIVGSQNGSRQLTLLEEVDIGFETRGLVVGVVNELDTSEFASHDGGCCWSNRMWCYGLCRLRMNTDMRGRV